MSDVTLKTARFALCRFLKEHNHQLLQSGKLELPSSWDQYYDHPIEKYFASEEHIGAKDLINLLNVFMYFHPLVKI